jgi:molybdopterin-binding protein
MKVGARNQLKARVTAIKRGQVMAQIKLLIPAESVMGSVITVESLEEMGLEVGDEVVLFVKAVNVLPVKVD